MVTTAELIKQSQDELKNRDTSDLIKMAQSENAQKPSGGFGNYLSETASNIPGSALNYGKNILQSIATFPGFGPLGASPQSIPGPLDTIKGMRDYAIQRYGSMDKALETFKSDPVGFMGDLSAVLGAAGGVASKAGLSRVGGAISKTAAAVEPGNIATAPYRGVRGLISKTTAPESLYERALEPSSTLTRKEIGKRVSTGLQQEIPVSKTGLQKSKMSISELNKDIADRISAIDNTGLTVDLNTSVNNLDNYIKQIKSENILPANKVAQVQGIVDELKSTHPAMQISPAQAQKYKVSLNKDLDSFYKTISTGGNVEKIPWAKATAKIADGLREELTMLYPELKNLNAKEGSLIQLNKTLERRINNVSKYELIRLIPAVLGSSDRLPLLKAFAAHTLNSPGFTSRLAITLNNARKKTVIPSTGLARPALATTNIDRYMEENK